MAPRSPTTATRKTGPRHRRARAVGRAPRGHRNVALAAVLTVVILGVSWVLGAGPSSRGTTTERATTSAAITLPRLVPQRATASSPAALPDLPFPSHGEGAVAVVGSGVLAESRHEHEVPIASLTKMMTALLVLRTHPLSGAEQGPVLHFTAADHAAWLRAAENDESNVELVNGESLTERQLLEALLIPSADNVADVFAKWVSGSEAAFVALMNETALSLGMDHTHYADASGVDPHTVSTAADQARLAAVLMENAVVRSIVDKASVPFPVERRVWNYNPALGTDGIVGVKSGFTSQANGCLVTAAWRDIGGHHLLLIAASTGQILGLGQAASVDEGLLHATTEDLRLDEPFGAVRTVAHLSVPWSGRKVRVELSRPLVVADFPGTRLSAHLVGAPVTAANLKHGWRPGAVVGELELSSQLGPMRVLPLTIECSLRPPPGRLLRNEPPVISVSH